MPWATASSSWRARPSWTSSAARPGSLIGAPCRAACQMLKDPVHPTLHVVEQCAAEVTALLVSGLDEAAPRRCQFDESLFGLGVQPRVHDGQPGGCRRRRHQPRIVRHRGAVDDQRDWGVSIRDLDRRAAVDGSPQFDRCAVIGDVPTLLGDPVGDGQGRVTEGAGKHVTQRRRTGALAEGDHEVGGGALGPAGPEEVDDERRRGARDDEVVGVQGHVRATPASPPLDDEDGQHRRVHHRGDEREPRRTLGWTGCGEVGMNRRDRQRAGDGQGDRGGAGQSRHERERVGRGDDEQRQPAAQPAGGVTEVGVDEWRAVPEGGRPGDGASEPCSRRPGAEADRSGCPADRASPRSRRPRG